VAERRRRDDLLPVPAAVIVAVAASLARRPRLLPVALSVAWSLRTPRWWARPPFLPVPPAGYARFRIQTMYGGDGRLRGADAPQVALQLVGWLDWVRRERSTAAAGH
jgi:hypothetical protein